MSTVNTDTKMANILAQALKNITPPPLQYITYKKAARKSHTAKFHHRLTIHLDLGSQSLRIHS